MSSQPTGWSLAMFWALVWNVTAVSWADVPQPVLDAEQSRIAAIARAARTAVSVFERSGQGGGSGVVISPDGYALTNYHVTQPCGEYMKCSMADGKLYDSVLVGFDPVGDVALIKLLGRDDFPAATLADSDQVRVGDWCFAVGNPFLLATDLQPTISYGIVSGVHRYQYPSGTLLEYADCLQTDAAINPGNSGGPLYNAQGEVIGINGRCSFEKRGRVNVGVGYAISINQIKNFMGHLRSGRIVDHATLGATVASDSNGKVVVSNVLDSSDAYRRGLRYGDELVSFGGRPIGTTNGFKNALGIYPKGWRLPLEVRRNGEKQTLNVRLTGVHSDTELLALVTQKAEKKDRQKRPKKEDDQPDKKSPPDDAPPKMPNGKPAPPPIPDQAAKLIKLRSGFANYYFNEQNRDHVWNAFAAKFAFPDALGEWKLAGMLGDERTLSAQLNNEQSEGVFADVVAKLASGKDIDQQLDPRGSGGLLATLHLWRRLLTLGPAKFGDVQYLGTLPVPGRPGLFDVLVGTHDVVECRFYFDPSSGELVSLEMYPDNDVDPCELSFYDYSEMNGRLVPRRIDVRHGDHVYGTIRIQEFSAAKKT